MFDVPFVLNVSRPCPANTNEPFIDISTADDPLPTVLKTKSEELFESRETRCTKIAQETTDDQ